MSFVSTATDLLPNAWSKLTLAATLFLALLPFALPESVAGGIEMPAPAQLLLLKVSVFLLLALVGSCATLLIVIHYHTRGEGQNAIADRILKVRAASNRQQLTEKALWSHLTK